MKSGQLLLKDEREPASPEGTTILRCSQFSTVLQPNLLISFLESDVQFKKKKYSLSCTNGRSEHFRHPEEEGRRARTPGAWTWWNRPKRTITWREVMQLETLPSPFCSEQRMTACQQQSTQIKRDGGRGPLRKNTDLGDRACFAISSHFHIQFETLLRFGSPASFHFFGRVS